MELENQDDVLVWDRLLQSVAAQLFDIDGGIHFHPLQDLLFGLDADGDEIVIFSTIDWSELNRIDPHFDLRPTTRFGFGVTSFDSFQDSLFVSVPGGILGVNVTAQEIAPTSADVTRGELVSGDVDDLVLSDNQDLTLRRVTSDIQSRTEVELKVTSPISTVELEVELESSVFARSPVDQTIELFDYTVASWETIDVRPAQPFSDSKVSVVPTGDPSRFIESGTLCLKARVRFNSQNPRQQFSSSIDKFVWAVNEIDD